MQNMSDTAVSNICTKSASQEITNQANIEQTSQSQKIIDHEAADFVIRKEAIAKLKVLKLRYDFVHPRAKHKCSFFNLLNDPAYREANLLKFSYQRDTLLSAYASQLLSLNLAGSLFLEKPDLGREVFVKIYPINATKLDTVPNFDRPSALTKLLRSISA